MDRAVLPPERPGRADREPGLLVPIVRGVAVAFVALAAGIQRRDWYIGVTQCRR